MSDPNLITAIESLDSRLFSISFVIAVQSIVISLGFLAAVLSLLSRKRWKGNI